MLRPHARSLVCLTLWILLACTAVAHASQQLGHMFMALAAAEDAPEALRSILHSNLDAYLAGATGPDIALISFPLQERLGRRHPGDWPHYYQTGEFTMNLLHMAATPAEEAFAWGWLTHYLVDSTIHPLVNAYGGYYTGGGLTEAQRHRAKTRHVMLELFENRHVIEIARGQPHFPDRYRVDHELVPVDLIAATYAETYGFGTEGILGIPGRLRAADLSAGLRFAARLMEVTTESFLVDAGVAGPRRRLSGWFSGAPARVLGAAMPTAEEYELLMNPLVIEDVELAREGDALFLEVSYRVNDLRLYKGFADDWDATYPQAVARIREVFARHDTEPRHLALPNLDMDVGLPEGGTFDPRAAHPGYPEISSMLVTGSVTDDAGRERSALGYSGVWVEFDRLDEVVWEGPAGHGSVRIPLDGSGPGPYQVTLGLNLADPETSEPYFEAGPKSRFDGTLWGGWPLTSKLLFEARTTCTSAYDGETHGDVVERVAEVRLRSDGRLEECWGVGGTESQWLQCLQWGTLTPGGSFASAHGAVTGALQLDADHTMVLGGHARREYRRWETGPGEWQVDLLECVTDYTFTGTRP